MIRAVISKINFANIINQNFFYNLSRLILFFLILILPLYVLPISTNFWIVNKTFLLAISLFLIFIFYLCHIIVTKKIEVPFSLIALIILLFLIFNLLSNYLSESPNFGRWGLFSSSHSLIAYFLYFLLFISTSILIKKEEIKLIFLILLISSFISLLITFLTIFNIYILPFNFTKFKLFNTIGTAYEFINWALFVFTFSLFLLSEIRYHSQKINIIASILTIANIILSLFLFLIYGFSSIWLIISLIIVLSLGQKYILKTPLSKREIANLILFVILIVLYAISPFLISNFVKIFKLPNIIDVRPTLITSLEIYKSEPSFKNILLGKGPNTFLYSWLKNKPSEINQTNFADVRFEQAYNYLLTLLTEGGLINFALFFFLILYIIFIFLFRKLPSEEDGSIIFISLLAIILTSIYHPAGLVNLSFFFIFLGLLTSVKDEKKKINFANTSPFILIFSYIGLIILIFIFAFLSYLFSIKYLGNIYYQKGLIDFNNNNLIASMQKISLAINLDPKADLYQRDMGNLLLRRAVELNNLLNNPQIQNAQGIQQEILNSISFSIQFLNNAINLNKIEPLNYVSLYNLYLTMGTSSQFVNLAIGNLNKAIEYEKNNPAYYINLAILYETIGQKNTALQYLQKAKFLSPFNPQIDKMIRNIQLNKPLLSE